MDKSKIATIPTTPGVYFFKNEFNELLYIGKAKVLRNRVRSYFAKQGADWKIDALMAEAVDVSYAATQTEAEALLLEAQLIQQHRPKFNTLLKSGQPFVYIAVTNDELPELVLVRNTKKRGKYFGPFLHKADARGALTYLLNTFALRRCNKKIENGCLEFHLGQCIGSCKSDFDKDAYKFRLNLAIAALKKDRKKFLHDIKKQVICYSLKFEFEKAKNLNEYAKNFDTIFTTLRAHFTPEKYATGVAHAIAPIKRAAFDENVGHKLRELLQLPVTPRVIDCFDISHFQSQSIVGSCVRFVDGAPAKNKFRRFNIKSLTRQNDYAALQEIVVRRYKDRTELPDVVLIDGGIGQRNAVKHLLPEVPVISLAKREETIFSDEFPQGVQLDIGTDVGQLLIALRDYAHHFAVSYHRVRRRKAF